MREIKLYSRKYPGMAAKVDDADFDVVSRHRWNVQIGKYATYAKSTKGVYMHRLLFPFAAVVDHKDHDGLNNTRDNLRPCDNSMNQHNAIKRVGRSRYRGITYNKRRWRIKRWVARLTLHGRLWHLGYFLTEQEAVSAYSNMKEKMLKKERMLKL